MSEELKTLGQNFSCKFCNRKCKYIFKSKRYTKLTFFFHLSFNTKWFYFLQNTNACFLSPRESLENVESDILIFFNTDFSDFLFGYYRFRVILVFVVLDTLAAAGACACGTGFLGLLCRIVAHFGMCLPAAVSLNLRLQ